MSEKNKVHAIKLEYKSATDYLANGAANNLVPDETARLYSDAKNVLDNMGRNEDSLIQSVLEDSSIDLDLKEPGHRR